jgi:hypothetical protein
MKKCRIFHLALKLHSGFKHILKTYSFIFAAELTANLELTKTAFSSKKQTLGSHTFPDVDGVMTQRRLINLAVPMNGSSQYVLAPTLGPFGSPEYRYFLFRAGRFITNFYP